MSSCGDKILSNLTRGVSVNVDLRHAWGAFYRLFSYHVLPTNVRYVLYLDPDAIVLANLANLWSYVEHLDQKDYLFSWKSQTSGFMLLRNTAELWNLALKLNISSMPSEAFNDQLVLRLIERDYPDRIGPELPPEWGLHWTSDYRFRKNLMNHFPQLAMGHLNGGGASPGPHWNDTMKAVLHLHSEWSSMFRYYIHLPWTNVWFLGESAIQGQEGHKVFIENYATEAL